MRWRTIHNHDRSAAGRNGSTDEHANADSDRNAHGGSDMDYDADTCPYKHCHARSIKHAHAAVCAV